MKRLAKENGMTLMEIMIVITLIGAIMAVGATKLNSKGRQLKQAVRRFSILGKDLHNKAKLFNKTYRITIQMDEEEGHSYWVESATGKVRLLSEERAEELEKLTKIQREQYLRENSFSLESTITRKPFSLPKPLFFKEVEYSARSEAVNEGTAYIHFFPQGLVEEAAIHITDGEKLNWTIVFHPITGKTNIYTKDIPLEEITQQ